VTDSDSELTKLFTSGSKSSSNCEDLRCDWKTLFMCNIWSDLKRYFLYFNCVTSRGVVCATVNYEVCKSAIALYCPHVRVIKSECVT
jgi:hypothetical protein